MDWLKRWENNQIGWHAEQINRHLIEYLSELNLAKKDKIFVPLCGKSLDMIYLLNQGLSIVAVEMSDLAIEMLNEDLGNEEVVAEFLELFPKADLENEDEFIIFCIGVTDPDDARLVKFIKNIKTHAKNHGDMAATKVIMMMFSKVVLAQETDDFDSVHTSVEELYPAYKTAAEEPAELEELLAYFEEVYAQG